MVEILEHLPVSPIITVNQKGIQSSIVKVIECKWELIIFYQKKGFKTNERKRIKRHKPIYVY